MSQFNKINTKSLKARLKLSDYEKIFKALNIPIYSKGKKYWSLYTACHNKNPYDGSPKLLFYFDIGMFQCLTRCGCSYDIIGLVQKRLGLLSKPCSFIDSVNFIIETTGIDFQTVKRINSPTIYNWQDNLEKFVRFKNTGSTLQIYDKSILRQFDNAVPQQWVDENISIGTMIKYHIGYYPRLQATTIPCFNQTGDLIGIRGRFWTEEQISMGKYRPISLLDGTTYKFPTSEVFYGIHWNKPEIERTGTVILVEGEKSVMKLDTLYNERNISLAMYGKNLGSRRRNQLIQMNVNKIIYVPDNDWIGKDKEAYNQWEKEIIQFGKQFKGYCTVDVVWDNLKLLSPKENAIDGGKKIWEKLYQNKENLI